MNQRNGREQKKYATKRSTSQGRISRVLPALPAFPPKDRRRAPDESKERQRAKEVRDKTVHNPMAALSRTPCPPHLSAEGSAESPRQTNRTAERKRSTRQICLNPAGPKASPTAPNPNNPNITLFDFLAHLKRHKV